MNDEDMIKRVIALYTFYLDDRNYNALSGLLGEDCLLAVGEFRLSGRAQIVTSVSNMQSEDPGRHLLGPTLVQLEASGAASAWTDMVGIVPGPEDSQVVAGSWRYHDRLAWVDQAWVFTHRYLHVPAEPLMDGAPALPLDVRHG